MQKLIKKTNVLIAIIMAFCLSFMTACGETAGNGSETGATPSTSETESGSDTHEVDPVLPITISAAASDTELKIGEDAQIYVTIRNTENVGYTLKSSKPSILTVSATGYVEVVSDPGYDVNVTVTATANADSTKTADVVFKVRTSNVVEGEVAGANGSLTSDMLNELANSSITVTGTIEDVYDIYSTQSKDSSQIYEFEVKMEKNKWFGSWKASEEDGEPVENAEVMTNYYQKGSEIVVTQVEDEYGRTSKATGYPLQEVYIDRHNQVQYKNVVDYLSRASLWDNQHLWNHINELVATNWAANVKYYEEDDVFVYTADLNSTEDWYLLAYLAVSFTPILQGADAFETIDIYVENGKITKMVAQSAVTSYTNEDDEAIAGEWTVATLNFSDIGTTTVPAPAAYTIPEEDTAAYDALGKALTAIRNADSYHFHTTERTTYAVSSDDSDYTIESANPSKTLYVQTKTSPSAFKPANSATGTEGLEGYVTKGGIYLVRTGKYTYTMDEDPYFHEVSGYRQYTVDGGDDYYEFFKPKYENGAYHFVGESRTYGTLAEDIMPKFDFASEIFEFRGETTVDKARMYQFALKATNVTKDIAMQTSMYSYAKSATASANSVVTILVTKQGDLYSISYPYDISGNYRGICTTVLSNINDTAIDPAVFSDENYIAKVYSYDWKDYGVKYYDYYHEYEDENGNVQHNWLRKDITADKVIEEIAKDRKNNFDKDMPSLEFVYNAFGNFYGPFFDYSSTLTTDSKGNSYYKKHLSLTATTDKVDEQDHITCETFVEIIEGITQDLAKFGFALDEKNSRMDGGTTGRQDNYATFRHGDVMIVINNNFTKNFWIEFYVNNDWSLN